MGAIAPVSTHWSKRAICREGELYKGEIYMVKGPLVVQRGVIPVHIKYQEHLHLVSSKDKDKLIKNPN